MIGNMERTNRRTKIVVGMSGGVDSSVAAYLLKEQGYDVIGVTMQLWQKEDVCDVEEKGGCCGLEAVEDARRVADKLGIPHYVLNFRQEFQRNVIDYFVAEYRRGRTPNPCIACNRYVKWEALLRRSLEMGADGIATGHYARVVELPNGRLAIAPSATREKDQSYVLYNLTQEQLRRTKMPVGFYTKPQIRGIASEIGLKVADKPDSQEICFVPDNDYAGFIERETGEAEETGNFVTAEGKVLGRHRGISHYTIGQRKGLNLSMGHPVFVTRICPETREVVIGEAEDVFADSLSADYVSYMGAEAFFPGQRLMAKIRYSHPGAPCVVEECITEEDGNVRIRIHFEEKVRAVTPGQAVVFYSPEEEPGAVLGGGIISPCTSF